MWKVYRKIRLIEVNAKCRHLKNLPVKALFVRCLSVWGPEPHTHPYPPPPNQRRVEGQHKRENRSQSWVKNTYMTPEIFLDDDILNWILRFLSFYGERVPMKVFKSEFLEIRHGIFTPFPWTIVKFVGQNWMLKPPSGRINIQKQYLHQYSRCFVWSALHTCFAYVMFLSDLCIKIYFVRASML